MIEALLEIVIVGTGLCVLRLFGRQDPGEFESMLAGIALWVLVGLASLAFAIMF
jgi:hypothetical protein